MSSAMRFAKLRAPLSIAAAMGLSLGVAMSSMAVAQTAQKPASQQPAQQQQQQPSGPMVVEVKGAPGVADWVKQCGPNEEVCITAREFVSNDDQPVLAFAMTEIKTPQGKERRARFLLPFSLALESGIRFSIDRSGFTPGKFQVCMPNGCFAEVVLKDDQIKTMKTGKVFNISVRNAAGGEIVFAVPAEGFAKAFDGPAIDPKVIEERQKQMEQDLQRRSEQMKKDLETRGTAGTPAPAPAPAQQ
ncbi:invasion associated locus B family protein [Microvirga sp. W0021]|uniref:Invasion associated locus B family protein n=1 Tax=Hohaiivirga grylli TaxID=3133970 RepID=A0ABV0BL11_9HYPH